MKNAGYKYSSQNTGVNGGPTRGGSGPKDTKGGTLGGSSTGMHDTNTISTHGANPPESSPSATSHSKNRYMGKGKC